MVAFHALSENKKNYRRKGESQGGCGGRELGPEYHGG
ncbi:hypothetical protein Goshw_026957 [Gossypium schwendimanii]|uniref:Uncharacterized protein n=1 Tax=Gossypium schwendimanii TaxID=34291 RepID=A0A7J9MWA2_GOSSC|nr:hypothetical protein [Gossypium schwendimanii]